MPQAHGPAPSAKLARGAGDRTWLALGALALVLSIGCKDAIPYRDPNPPPETGSACDGLASGARCGLRRICIEGKCTEESCGDGFLALNELCDDGNQSNDDDCSLKCIPTTCGNSQLDPDEDCDDGNQDDGDGCPATCRGAVCGNGKIEEGEQCEWPQVSVASVGESYGCTANCQRDYACEECQRANCVEYAVNATRTVNAVTDCLGQAPADAGSSDTDAGSSETDETDAGSSEAGAADAGSSDAGDTNEQRCVAVVNCALKQGCGFDADAGTGPVLACFCGQSTSEACRTQGPASDGVCGDEIKAAAGDVGSDVTARATDTSVALGKANALLSCYRDHCAAECGPRKSGHDAGTPSDAGTELDTGTELDADMQLDPGPQRDAAQLEVDAQPDA